MGLDIAFSRKKAIKAGIELRKREHPSQAIAEAREAFEYSGSVIDAGYLEYLSRTRTLMAVPYTDHCVQDDGTDEEIIVRANKWGNTYGPLTKWLSEKKIGWTEF